MDFAVLALISLFAHFIGATAGFGDAVIIVTLTLATGIYSPNALEFIVPTVVVLALLMSLYLVVRHHDAIDRKLLLRKILPVAGIGLPIGMLIFNVIKPSVLVIALGSVVVSFSTLELILFVRSGGNERMPMSDLQACFWLFSGGVVQGLYASGGPLVVYYAGRNIPDKRVFRSTLSALWLILNTVLMVRNIATGHLTGRVLVTALSLLPVMALGIALGELMHSRIPERKFRVLVYSVLTAAGLSVLLRALLA